MKLLKNHREVIARSVSSEAISWRCSAREIATPFGLAMTLTRTFFRGICALILPLLWLSFSSSAHAQTTEDIRQMSRRFEIGNSQGAIIILGYVKDQATIEKILEIAAGEAKRLHEIIDWKNPQSEVARLNQVSGSKFYPVSKEVLNIFKAAARLSEWTEGAFDIAAESPVGTYDNIKLDEKGSRVRLQKKKMTVRFDAIFDGYLADYLIRYLYGAGIHHAMVKVGNTFRGVGRSLNGPWRIQVQDDEGTYAHRAMKLTVGNAGVATVSAAQFRQTPPIDPRTKQSLPVCCKGATVAMKEAALAQGMAYTMFILGPQGGVVLMEQLGNAKGMVADNEGKFVKTSGF